MLSVVSIGQWNVQYVARVEVKRGIQYSDEPRDGFAIQQCKYVQSKFPVVKENGRRDRRVLGISGLDPKGIQRTSYIRPSNALPMPELRVAQPAIIGLRVLSVPMDSSPHPMRSVPGRGRVGVG